MSSIKVISKTLELKEIETQLQSSLAVMDLFTTFECYGRDGLVLYTGMDRYGAKLAIVLGELPPLDGTMLVKLFNRGWSQRFLAIMYGTHQSRISTMIKGSKEKRTFVQ